MTLPDNPMIDETVSIELEGIALEGTLSLPADRAVNKAVLFVAGSGPLDRNQNSAHVQLNIFNAIAQQLASNGIASVRYDKRGCGNSTGVYETAGHSDLVRDATAWLQFLNTHESVNPQSDSGPVPVFVIGHSEGAIIAPQLCSANPFHSGPGIAVSVR